MKSKIYLVPVNGSKVSALIQQVVNNRSFKLNFILALFVLFPAIANAQWSAKQIASSTYSSVLRPMSQGVYDHYSDKSFFCFMQENSNPYVVECDHSGGLHTWGTPQKVQIQSSASKYNYPTIDILPDRRLVLCYAAPFDTQLGFAISNSPSDVTAWTTKLVNIGKKMVEYPRIKVDRRGYIYIFYIQQPGAGAHQRWYYYVRSKDAGVTWDAPVLAIERELDDPYGMCELYVGYSADEPYRLGQPEKWWFAYTSSSGFQYTGTHDGGDNSTKLVDSKANWGSGSNFTYRWLYNITKGTNSGITSADANTVVPAQTMDWDNGDKYGVAYHNIYHSDVYVTAFRPDNGHWYDAANNDLGTVVSRNEMETETARPYKSPTPPASKDVGFIPVLTVNDQGYPTILEKDVFYSWNGMQWVTVGSNGPSGDYRNFWFADSKYYMLTNKLQLYNSSTTASWANIFSITLPNVHSYSLYAVPVKEGHSEACINVHEYSDSGVGNAYGVSSKETQTPAAIVLRTTTPVRSVNEVTTVNAFITEKANGARSRVRNATTPVTLSIESGTAVIANSTVSASGGLVAFSVTPTVNNQLVILKASSPGLDNYYLNLYVGDGTGSTFAIKNQNLETNDFIIYPNPFGSFATIKFSLQNKSNVILKIFDIQGREITTLIAETKPAGTHHLLFNATKYGIKKGFYIAKLQTETNIKTIVMDFK